MEWERYLIASGCRVTASRRAVARVLQEADAPLLPREILRLGRRIHGRLGLVTVYRTLALLIGLGLARRVHCDDGCHGYVGISPGHRHHVICQGCGGAAEFPGEDDMRALVERVEIDTGYRVEGHLLQLFGLCPECRERGGG